MCGAAIWNWALARLIRTEHEGWMYRARFQSLSKETSGQAKRIGMNAQVFQNVIQDVCVAWDAYRRGTRGRPHWKGARNRLASLPFRNDKRTNSLRLYDGGVRLQTIGNVRARIHRDWPDAQIICGRLVRRARGWYFVAVLEAEPKPIPLVGDGAVGIDLGYSTLATLSSGEKIEHPNEFRRISERIAQANRGLNYRLLGRLQQSLALARRTRNHAISRDLVSRFGAIYVSKDNLRGIQRRFGKSVLSAGHGELREMLATKCRQAGRVYVEVPNKNSTKTCSSCSALTGPTGLRGLSVRLWACSACGAHHDRDCNAAVNTLNAGAVLAHESIREGASEISHRYRLKALSR